MSHAPTGSRVPPRRAGCRADRRCRRAAVAPAWHRADRSLLPLPSLPRHQKLPPTLASYSARGRNNDGGEDGASTAAVISARRTAPGPDWIHEVKHDGHRMLVIRENERVRLPSRNGSDWTKRYPWIAEAALRNRQKRFVIDGEAVILGVDGISDFNALHSGQHGHKVQPRLLSVYRPTARECVMG